MFARARINPDCSRPAASVTSRRRLASTGVSAPGSIRQRQLVPIAPWLVHPRLAVQAEHVLSLDHRHARRRGEGEPDQRPPGLVLAHAMLGEHLVDRELLARVERVVPAPRRVVVVGAGVDDPVLDVVLEPVRVVRVARVEPELEHEHPGQPELVAQRLHRRRDHAEVLGHERQRRRARPRRRGTGRARARASSARSPRCGRPPARPSRRRSRGSGRSEPRRTARACGAGARPTSGSAGGGWPASRTAGCPTAARCPSRHRAARRPRSPPGRARGARGGRRSPARRRSPHRPAGVPPARRRTSAAPPIRGRSGPGRPPRLGARSAPSRRSRTPPARGSARSPPRRPRRAGRPAGRARRRTPSAPCTASRGGPAARAAAPATRTGPPRPASRRTRRLPFPGGRQAAMSGGVALRRIEAAHSLPACLPTARSRILS